ncbi:type II methionyl aminopeptidase [Candidatus Pacearchaeota archaeon]|nr:type II methionyl aminopeptidase [Candidatus Pacearchaeota archaeon]
MEGQEIIQKELESIRKAGKIVANLREYARKIVKKDVPLLEIAEKIEAEIIKQGGKPAFPVNLGINEYAAHYTPSYNDETLASGLIKVDFGVAINGFTADNALSFDLENNETNKKLIKTSEEALKNGIEAAKQNKSLGEIGSSINETAEKANFTTIKNLSGHSIENNNLHAGITIPNYNNGKTTKLDDGIYAIEPFIIPNTATGMVYDGKPSGIYELVRPGNVRDSNARELLNYITETYNTLPFCSRWLVKKFGTRALISLSHLEKAGILHQFSQLIEKSKSVVAQSEHTLIIHQGKVEVVTE